jgi:hypothetical protein
MAPNYQKGFAAEHEILSPRSRAINSKIACG